MSDPSDNKKSLDLSSLDFGPSWAREGGSDSNKKFYKEERSQRGPRRDGNRDGNKGGRRNDNRGGGSGNPSRDDRGNDRGGRREYRGRRHDDRGGERRYERKPQVPAPEGVHAEIMPLEEGVDNMAKQISASGRTYSVFDLARIVLKARERFHLIFQQEKEEPFLYQSQRDGAVFLTQEECLAYFSKSEWSKNLYVAEQVEVEAPGGNFPTVAVCGFSGKAIAPPNYHGYQSLVAELHAAEFSNMSIDQYRKRIKTVKDEEKLAEWQESMKTKTVYRVVIEDTETTDEDAKNVKEGVTEAVKASEGAIDPVTEETPEIEPIVSEAPTDDQESNTEESVEVTCAAKTGKIKNLSDEVLENVDARNAHFKEHFFEKEFRFTHRANVPSSIKAAWLSPALLTLLKETVADQTRYPGKLSSFLCRQLSGRHLAVFKWQGKLHAGPSRPHTIPADVPIAERPQKMLSWVNENSGKGIDSLWQTVLPGEIDEKEKREWYHDLHWLLNQGYLILLENGELHLSSDAKKKATNKHAKKASKKQSKPQAEQKKSAQKDSKTSDSAVNQPPADSSKQADGESA